MILSKWLKSSIRLINGAQTGTTTPGQSGPGTNSSEEVLHIHQSSRTEPLASGMNESLREQFVS